MVGVVSFSATEERQLDICLTIRKTMQQIVELYTPDLFHPALSTHPKVFFDYLRSKFCKALISRQRKRGQVCEVTGRVFSDKVFISPAEAKYIADNIDLATNGFWTWDLQIRHHYAGWIVICVDDEIEYGNSENTHEEEPRTTSAKKDAAKLLVTRAARYGLEEELEALNKAKMDVLARWEVAQGEIEEQYLSRERDRLLSEKYTELDAELKKVEACENEKEELLKAAWKEEEWMVMQGIDIDDDADDVGEGEADIEVARAGPSRYGKTD